MSGGTVGLSEQSLADIFKSPTASRIGTFGGENTPPPSSTGRGSAVGLRSSDLATWAVLSALGHREQQQQLRQKQQQKVTRYIGVFNMAPMVIQQCLHFLQVSLIQIQSCMDRRMAVVYVEFERCA